MKVIKKFKYPVLLIAVLIVGFVLLESVISASKKTEEQRQQEALQKAHHEAVIRIETGISIYATIVSSLRSFVENSQVFPNDSTLHSFLNGVITDVGFQDSIVVSFLDTNHVFQYSVTPYQIDPTNLAGTDVRDLRTSFEIEKMDSVLATHEIVLFDPINLVEGWPAFPFNFTVRDKKGEAIGYMAPVLHVKHLLNNTYKGGNDSLFVYRFLVNDTIDLTREIVHDGSMIYNERKDPEYYKNFDVREEDFIYSNVAFYGMQMKVGTAYKHPPKDASKLGLFTFLWFGLLCIFSALALLQLIRNNRLYVLLRKANGRIAEKNDQLAKSLLNVQTLLKEVHHRVKNNLQIISSLLNLQRNEHDDQKVHVALDASKGRIQSMALVHQKLYGNETLTSINVHEYCEQLVNYVEDTLALGFESPDKKINISKELYFDMDTMVPLGLIINELVTNSYKYAFSDLPKGQLCIDIEKQEDFYVLKYHDNGPGVPETIDIHQSGSLGLELVNILTEQLSGTLKYNRKEISEFIITFK